MLYGGFAQIGPAMKMHQAEKAAVVLLLMALGSLAVASWAFLPEEAPESTRPASSFSVEGTVIEASPTKTGGHLILHLDTTPLPVFISRDAGAERVRKAVVAGALIRVTGELSDFAGKKEIRVARAEDIELMGS